MKIISTIFYTVFVALVVGIAGLLLGSMLPIPGNIEVKIVKSGSMEPAIHTGSIVVVKPVGLYAVGDVITFGKDTKTEVPTTHRIMAVNPDGTYMVKGDANEEQDPNPVQRNTIIGKVVFDVPYAGFVLDFARQPIGFTLLIAIPAGLVILEELLTIFKETKKWWRRRNGDDSDANGGEESRDLTRHLKMVYAKRRAMDEILVPMYATPRFYEFAWWHRRLGLHKDAYGTSTALTLCLVFMSTLFAGASGGTLSYFQDIERSVGNILQAGVWALPEQLVLPEDEITSFAALSQEEESIASSTPETGEVLGESDVTPEEEEETSPAEVVAEEENQPESAAADSGTPPAEAPADGTAQKSVDEPLPESPPQEPAAESPAEPPPTELPAEAPADPAPTVE